MWFDMKCGVDSTALTLESSSRGVGNCSFQYRKKKSILCQELPVHVWSQTTFWIHLLACYFWPWMLCNDESKALDACWPTCWAHSGDCREALVDLCPMTSTDWSGCKNAPRTNDFKGLVDIFTSSPWLLEMTKWHMKYLYLMYVSWVYRQIPFTALICYLFSFIFCFRNVCLMWISFQKHLVLFNSKYGSYGKCLPIKDAYF